MAQVAINLNRARARSITIHDFAAITISQVLGKPFLEILKNWMSEIIAQSWSWYENQKIQKESVFL